MYKKSNYYHLRRIGILALILLVTFFFSAFTSVLASSPQAPEFPNAPAVTTCANFTDVGAGNSVEGLGTVHSNLNISTSGNAVAVVENQDPRSYGAPNGENSISNGGVEVLGSGFSDVEQAHDYEFTFSPDVTVDYFSVQMLDYGDFNPVNATEHTVTLAAYNADGNSVSSDMLSFTSDGNSLPSDGSAGDLWLTGDALSANPGEPGNFTFTVTGNEIVRIALEFTSDLGEGATDPNFALAILCFSTEDEPPAPPAGTVCADFAQIPVGTSVEGLGTIHPDLNIETTGNAIVVAEMEEPKAYGAPNGDNSILNGGVDVLLNGFFDETKVHEYSFTFGQDVTVDYFSVQMLDYGDFNPVHATEQSVSLVAYDASGALVDINTLAYTSDPVSLPRDSSVGDLWFTGDAITANPGQPGNYTFFVTGADIARLELQFASDLGPGATDPNFALSILCFAPQDDEPPTPPVGTVCADFAQIPVGATVEGLGTIHPDLNIATTGNAIAVAEMEEPKAYGAPNGENSILNGGVDVLLNGFFDETKVHEYSFTFGQDVTVDYFSVQMLDYGDFNPVHATEQSVSLVAYDASGALVDINTLAYTSDPVSLPRDSSVGDLWFTGDAMSALPGQPGNFTFAVEGLGIARLEMQFASDLGPGATDPNFALSLLCFDTEKDEPELDPPTAVLELLRPKQAPEIGGKFLVEYACSENAPNLVSATINGYDVVNGQEVSLVVDDDESARIVDDLLIWLFAPEFSLDVTCADDNGNEVSTSVMPEFDTP